MFRETRWTPVCKWTGPKTEPSKKLKSIKFCQHNLIYVAENALFEIYSISLMHEPPSPGHYFGFCLAAAFLQILPEIFYMTEMWRLGKTLECLPWFILQPGSDWCWCLLGVIVLLKEPVFRFSYMGQYFCQEYFDTWWNLLFLHITSPWQSKISPKHKWATAMLHSGYGAHFGVYSMFILHEYWAWIIRFLSHICPQHTLWEPPRLVHIVILQT